LKKFLAGNLHNQDIEKKLSTIGRVVKSALFCTICIKYFKKQAKLRYSLFFYCVEKQYYNEIHFTIGIFFSEKLLLLFTERCTSVQVNDILAIALACPPISRKFVAINGKFFTDLKNHRYFYDIIYHYLKP